MTSKRTMAGRGTGERSAKWIRTRIEEPFPVFYGHINQTCRKANDPATKGPFYDAGSEWFEPFSERNFAARRAGADHLRRDGYTVSVDVVERSGWPWPALQHRGAQS